MTSVTENSANPPGTEVAKENGAAAPAVEDDQGNDKTDAELEIQNNEDLEALIDDDEDKDRPRRRSWDRTRGRDKRSSREKGESDRDRDRGRRRSRSLDRNNRRDTSRRDPSKSNKDIEQDKARAKKESDTKALVEKEKAIKTLLDSNDVVPPGTEEDAIQIIADKNRPKKDAEDSEAKRNRDNRKRSPIHNRLGPRRSPARRRSKSPIRFSPRRRSPSPDRRRRSPPYERKRSTDRDLSNERRDASKRRLRERRDRERSRSRHRSRSPDRGRRSRSYDRRRSRSFERRRRSRSYDRHSPRRRRSISRSRSPTRPRRRSPFINELARQFTSDALRQGPDGPLGPMPGPPGSGPPYMPGPPGGPPGGPLDPRMMPAGAPPGLLPLPGPPPGMPPGPMDVHPGGPMHPGGPPMMLPGPPFGGFEPVMGFEPLGRGLPGPDYGSGPLLYGQPGMPMGAPVARPLSPQPVPAPGLPMFPGGMMRPIGSAPAARSKYSPNLRDSPVREERMRTPEPPIISDFKPSEKTSLSSLLEASVSLSTAARDTSSSMPSFKGFKPEVIRQCERALRSLPPEDPRLQMKGRFFFDPSKKLVAKENLNTETSNSVLLRKGRTEIHWDEEFNQMTQVIESKPLEKKRVITLQKICQTEEMRTESVSVQTEVSTKIDFGMQVGPDDLIPLEERRAVNAGVNVGFDERHNNYDDRHNFDRGSGGGKSMNDRYNFDRGTGGGQSLDNRYNFDRGTGAGQSLDNRFNFDRGTGGGQSFDNRYNFDRGTGGGHSFDDRHDWNARDNYDQSNNKQPMRDNEDLRWSLSKNSSRATPWGRAGSDLSPPRQFVTDHMHGSGGGLGHDFRNLDMMRERPDMMDARDRLMDRGMMDFKERDVDVMDREVDIRGDVQGMDVPRNRDLMIDMNMRGDGGRPDMGGRGGPIGDFVKREPMMDDFKMRNRYGDDFIRGPLDRPLDLDRNEPIPRGRDSSPSATMEDGDDLEIIEERVFDRDSWKRASGVQLNNARGGAAMRNINAPKRPPFRGRIGSFRSNF